MKVKEFMKKYRMSSNADVLLQSIKSGELTPLNKQNILHLDPPEAMEQTLNSFEIIDNVMILYVKK